MLTSVTDRVGLVAAFSGCTLAACGGGGTTTIIERSRAPADASEATTEQSDVAYLPSRAFEERRYPSKARVV
jgi:hypothetical protein